MTVLDKLTFVAFNPLQNNNPIAVRCRKLIAKIYEQIQLASNKDYTPTQHKWVTDEHGNQHKVEVPKRVKRWWLQSSDGKINAIELNSEAEVLEVLAQMKEAADSGELNSILEKQAQFGRPLQTKRA